MGEEQGRLANGGFGVCHLSAGKRGACALGGIGCDQNHVAIKAMNEQAKAAEATGPQRSDSGAIDRDNELSIRAMAFKGYIDLTEDEEMVLDDAVYAYSTAIPPALDVGLVTVELTREEADNFANPEGISTEAVGLARESIRSKLRASLERTGK